MTADWCVAWKENFGLGISIGELCRLKANAPQLVTTVHHKRQYSSLSHAKVQPKQQQQLMSDKELLEVRHGAATSASQLQKIRKVVPCMRGWTLERVRQAELLLIPQFDRSIGNTGLLHSIVQFLFLGNAQHVKEHCKGGRILRAEYTLRLFLYGDVYSPRGTPIVCQKVAIVDPQGCLLPPKGRDIPGCTQLLTWRELLKADFVAWRDGRVEEINHCVSTPVFVKVNGQTILVRFAFGYSCGDHHHQWSEFRCRDCVNCISKRNAWLEEMFLATVQTMLERSSALDKVHGLEHAHTVQPVLHNIKGAISRAVGVIGRVLSGDLPQVLLQVIGTVAKRYQMKETMPSSSSRTEARTRFRSGVSLTGREARTLVCILAQQMVLPLPLHSLALALCHIVVLTYSNTIDLSQVEWKTLGIVWTAFAHVVMEYCERGSTCTLYWHGLTHLWLLPRLPIEASDETGEGDLRLSTRFAPVTSTCPSLSILEVANHELWKKFIEEKSKRCSATRLWKPKRRPIILEQCVVSGTEMWRSIWGRALEEVKTIRIHAILMDTVAFAIKIKVAIDTPSEVDHFCICGKCADAKPASREWQAFDDLKFSQWPILGIGAVRTFATRKERKKARKDRKVQMQQSPVGDACKPYGHNCAGCQSCC